MRLVLNRNRNNIGRVFSFAITSNFNEWINKKASPIKEPGSKFSTKEMALKYKKDKLYLRPYSIGINKPY